MAKDIGIWIGREFYPTPEDYIDEALRLGCSRKLSSLPRNVVLGESKAWLFHKSAPSRVGKRGERRTVKHGALIIGYFIVDGFVA